jgi:hypothetical protein
MYVQNKIENARKDYVGVLFISTGDATREEKARSGRLNAKALL